MPVTTPMASEMSMNLPQNLVMRKYSSLPVR